MNEGELINAWIKKFIWMSCISDTAQYILECVNVNIVNECVRSLCVLNHVSGCSEILIVYLITHILDKIY